MTYGPIDLIALEFKGNKFKGDILASLIDLVEQDMIRIIDLIVIVKDKVGDVTAIEMNDLEPEVAELFGPLDVQVTGMVTEDDVVLVGEALDNNCSAGILLFENLWAVRFKDAVIEAGGRVLMQERIPHEVVLEALVDMAMIDDAE